MTGSEFFPGGMGVFTCTQNQFLVFEDGPSQTFQFQWATYYDAADQSGLSRIYGGIHPDFDDFPARVLGAQVAVKAHTRALELFQPIVAPPCVADLNADGQVAAQDLALLLGAWGTNNPAADIVINGTVDGQDLAAMLSSWGTCPTGQ
jgi:hypothetical protein